jgi:hypothetical protein
VREKPTHTHAQPHNSPQVAAEAQRSVLKLKADNPLVPALMGHLLAETAGGMACAAAALPLAQSLSLSHARGCCCSLVLGAAASPLASLLATVALKAPAGRVAACVRMLPLASSLTRRFVCVCGMCVWDA